MLSVSVNIGQTGGYQRTGWVSVEIGGKRHDGFGSREGIVVEQHDVASTGTTDTFVATTSHTDIFPEPDDNNAGKQTTYIADGGIGRTIVDKDNIDIRG